MKKQWNPHILGIALLGTALVILAVNSTSSYAAKTSSDRSVIAPAATLTVTSTADSGPGTLRQALLDAGNGDTITFDPVVFPPGSPAWISLSSGTLPAITQGDLTIDASNAGVYLDGSTLTNGDGFHIVSNGNAIQGMAILNFPGSGVRIDSGASHNLVGGDEAGERNHLWVNQGHGVSIAGNGTMSNTVSGNYIGVFSDGTSPAGNTQCGVAIDDGASYNVVGGDSEGQRNVISGNGAEGVLVAGQTTQYNRISGNYIGTDASGTVGIGNAGGGIDLHMAGHNVVGGINATPGGACTGECNLISGNTGDNGLAIFDNGAEYNVVTGNHIGTSAGGTASIPNANSGVLIRTDAHHNAIGGSTPGERNVISGNSGYGVEIRDGGAAHNTVSGNYVGTDASGTAPIGNADGGIKIAFGPSHNLVGGDSEAKRNVISGNGWHGVHVYGSDTVSNTISGNYIGVDATGMTSLGNDWHGVCIGGGARYTIVGGQNATPGGACTGECNVVSGNPHAGIMLDYQYVMSTTVSGNYVGTDVNGTVPLPNQQTGIFLGFAAQHNIVGGDTPAERNVVGGNGGNGIGIGYADSSYNTIRGNYVGLDASGTRPLGNGNNGISVDVGSHNLIGGPTDAERNIITYNSSNGVSVQGSGAVSNTIQNNWIGIDADGTGGIDARDLVVADDGTVFLGDFGGGVFRSDDAAASWQAASSGLSTLEIEIVAVAPNFAASQRLWAWGNGTLFSSDDAGASWSFLSDAWPDGLRVLEVSPDYSTDQTLLAAVYDQGFYKSTDGGASWTQVHDSYDADCIAFSPGFAVDQVVLAGRSWNGVLRSSDGGDTWTDSSSGLSGSGALDLAFAAGGQTVLLVGDNCGSDAVYRSTDAGQTWQPSGNGVVDCGPEWQIAVSPDFATDGIALVAEDNVFRATDGGLNWTWSSSGAYGSRGVALAFSPDFAADQISYLVSFAGVFRSTDGGLTWTWAGANLADWGNGSNGVEICCGAGATEVLKNVVARNGYDGIVLHDNSSIGSRIETNLVGLAPDGATRGSNGGAGINVNAPDVIVNGNTSAANALGLQTGTQAGHLTISGNQIGTDISGTTAIGNGYQGLWLNSAWDTVRDNLISGNWHDGIWAAETVSHTVFAGNLVGVDASGSKMLANGRPVDGPRMAPGPDLRVERLANSGEMGNGSSGLTIRGHYNTVGGSTVADRNVISGNSSHGLRLDSGAHDNVVLGNYIGIDSSGSMPVGNASYGVYINDDAHDNVIGGSTAAECNIVSSNAYGLRLGQGAYENTISGNYIGTDITGLASLGNTWYGILIVSDAHDNVIGGNTSGERNIISGNGYDGILIWDAAYNTIQGNYIGADANGLPVLGNAGQGIRMHYGASYNVVTDGNLIAGNSGDGIGIYRGDSLYNTIARNSIYENDGLGIDLADGGNTELPAPVITAYDLAAGTASGAACANCTVEVFSDDYGEGRWFEGTTSADADGNWSLDKGNSFAGLALTATATDGAGNTSEFGQDWPADPPPAPFVAAPVCGVTNQAEPAFAGFAQMGSTVRIGASGLDLGQATTDDWNRWELASWETMPDASYTVTATATTAWGTSAEAVLDLTVDTGLCYDPVEVTLTQHGVTQHPRNAAGCVDPGEVLGVNLWPGLPVTFSVPVEVPTATVYVEANSVRYDLADPDGDCLFAGAFPAPPNGGLVVLLVVDCGGGQQTMQIGSTIDPDGYVYDAALTASTGVTQTVAGVTVTLYVSDTVRSRWLAWDAPLYGQVNPQVTGEDGYFAFFTPPGTYRLKVDGQSLDYALYESPILTVVDEPIRYNVPLWPYTHRIFLPLVLRGD